MTPASTPRTVIDDYIDGFPPDVQARLAMLRSTIREHAPKAVEKFSYRMPTFHLGTNLVHFAAYENHIGFYPTGSGIAAFAEEIADYKSSKGAVQFPHDRPLPLDLVARMVKLRVAQCNEKRAKR